MLPILYGRSETGKLKQWSAKIIDFENHCEIHIEHGYIDGKKQIDIKKILTGKNIGKSNETDIHEQALLEATSLWKKKLDDGYVEDKNNIPKDSDGLFLPMLAQKFDKKKIKFPCFVQPKLDGMRAIAKKENGKLSFWSRAGKEITVPDKIIESLSKSLPDNFPLDGELYVHGWTFQELISSVKKKILETDSLEYHIYDFPHETLNFKERYLDRLDSIRKCFENEANIKFVETLQVQNLDDILKFEKQFIASGYEGLMVRNQNGLYKYKNRSDDLQKLKQFMDEEYEIIGGKQGSGREEGLVIFQCKTKDEKPFDARPRGSHKKRAEMFINLESYIGKMLTVRFFELTDDGIPRFPVGIIVRDYE